MMPSRRSIVGATGALLVGCGGCLGFDQRVTGYIQFKSIAGVTETAERVHDEHLISVDATFSSKGPELSYLNDDWADRFETPLRPTVSDALHEDLTRRFDRVRYVVGVTSPSWAEEDESVGSYNVATTRENFNRVQVQNRVTVSSDGTSLTIYNVDGMWTFTPTPS